MVALSDFLNLLVKYLIEHQLATIIMAAVGLSGGFWLFTVKFGLGKIWKKVQPEIESAAHLADQKKKDDKIADKYEADLHAHAPESQLIEDEGDILNGGRK